MLLFHSKATLLLLTLCPFAVATPKDRNEGLSKAGNLRALQDECQQTDFCVLNGGKCVKISECVGVCKDDHCNGDDCTCQITEPCPMTEECRDQGGICTRDCVSIPDVTDCIENICELDDCMCKTCLQDEACLEKGGKCLLFQDCLKEAASNPSLDCHPELCGEQDEDCACLAPTPPCPTTDECRSVKGVCVKDCVRIPGVLECRDLCNDEECECKNCLQNDERCRETDGECLLIDDCLERAALDPNLVCDETLCSGDEPSDECACLTKVPPPPPCPMTEKCRLVDGVCTDVCVPIAGVLACDDFCEREDCKCKNCLQKDEKCLDNGGECLLLKDCLVRASLDPSLDCDLDLCGTANDECACLLPSPPCPNTQECQSVNGECVKACVPVLDVVRCDNLCHDEDCECKSCVENEKCLGVGGKCILLDDCKEHAGLDPNLVCEPDLCVGDEPSDECACLFPTPPPPPPCPNTQECQSVNGECVKKCVPVLDVVQCDKLCHDEDCECKNCIQNEKCLAVDGKCLLLDDCKERANLYPNLICKPDLCVGDEPSDECACLFPTPPPCDDTDDCRKLYGKCTKDCVTSSTGEFKCGDECHSDECKCLRCKTTEKCLEKDGVCEPFCVAGPGEVCDPKLCDLDGVLSNSPCACKYKVA